MHKRLIQLVMVGLVLGLSNNVLAQKKQHLSKDTSSTGASNAKDSLIVRVKAVDTTSTIQLSPVVVAVNASQAHATDNTLLQPLTEMIPNNFVSGNLNTYVIHFIKNYYQDNNRNLQDLQSKSGSYFSIIEKIFDQFGVPEELKYLAVIESGLNTNARSQAGAVGTWQLMSGTARLLGLQVNRHRDDRRDLYKSTIAAAKYLSRLHDRFGNWLLVIAAYNCGPGGVLRAIDESGSADFWDMKKYLPQESQRHVMKFLATAYILDRFASFFGVDKTNLFGNDFQPIPDNSPVINTKNLAIFRISGKYSLPVIAKYTSMNINELNKLNPGFDKMMSSASNAYDFRLPADKMVLFKEKRNAILNESVEVLMENNRQLAEANYPPAKELPLAKEERPKG
jgi:membrane-bound lytic murein transglycosylase D